MKTIDFLTSCNGDDVTVSIDYDGILTLDGYDPEYDQAAQEFGYEPTTCHEIIEEWEKGWYFRIIAKYYCRFVDSQDIAKAIATMAEHAGEFVTKNDLFNNAKQKQPRVFREHMMVINVLKDYAKTGINMSPNFIEEWRKDVHMAGSRFFSARDLAGSDYSDAMSNAMMWLINPEHATYGLMDIWNCTEFLAMSVAHVGVPGIDAESEKIWQLRCFIDIANP
jgi:hypothetical protein